MPSTSNGAPKVDKAIRACMANAYRLLEETDDLEFRKPASTRYFLAVIAQEEAAKAFLLHLVKEGIVPLTPALRRAINDHACKHLVGMIMDYMIMHWDTMEELKRLISRDLNLGHRLPNDVGSALEILRYEKIGRWTANNWVWADDPNYDVSALSLSEGKKDRRKQDALYVRLGSDGQVASEPTVITGDDVASELAIAGRYMRFLRAIVDKEPHGFDDRRFERVMEVLGLLFGTTERQPIEEPS